MATDGTTQIDAVIEDFEFLDDWEQRFEYLIDLGQKLPALDPTDQVEANRVHGCQATVYMLQTMGEEPQPRLRLAAHSNAHIVNGLIAILLKMYHDKTTHQVLDVDTAAIFGRMGLEEHLSPTRRNGLGAMVKRIRTFAHINLPKTGDES